MGKLDRLIEDIERASHDEKSVLSRKVYSDMPLVFTASRMQSFAPDKIAGFRREFRTRSVYTADPKAFLLQALYMADYEDDYCEETEFSSAFPSYSAMNDNQLRTYFSWRTKLRRGDLKKTSLSYAYVYIFELLNLVGADSPSDAFEKLRDFFDDYGKLDETVTLYRARWLTDFAVFYGIEKFYGELPCCDAADENGGILFAPEKHTDSELLRAADFFSSYSVMHSAVYKAAPRICEKAVAAVIRGENVFHTPGGVVERCCKRVRTSYFMFASAIVYTADEQSDRAVVLPDGRKFCEINNHWVKTAFVKDSALSHELGKLMRFIDTILRGKLKIKNKIKPVSLNRELQNAVERCIDGVFDEIRRENMQKRMDSVKIDFGKLDAIRHSSDETGERLMTDEDIDGVSTDGCPRARAVSDALPDLPTDLPTDSSTDLPTDLPTDSRSGVQPNMNADTESDLPMSVLRIILDGGDASAAAKSAGVTLSMVCDEINERFYNEFCDTVIDFDNEKPFVVPDYVEDLRGMFE